MTQKLNVYLHVQLKVRDTIATGVERLVQIGVDKHYFLSGSEHVQQNAEVSGKQSELTE